MQQRSQIPKADDKTTIKALIKGLTPGPTASHLMRKKPKTVQGLFHELEEYILSDDDHHRRVAERNEVQQGNREMTWRPQSQNPRNINNVEHHQPDQNSRPSTRGGFTPRGRGEEEDPRDSRITTQETRTSIVSIMEEDTAPKGAQKPRRTSQKFSKKKLDEHRILNAEPDSPEFLAAIVHELSTKSGRLAAISTATTIMATLSAVFSSIASNSVNTASTSNSRNSATTT
jgi:hypothetical protein